MGDVKVKCPKCGSENFVGPARELGPTDYMTCAACGFSDTYKRLILDQLPKPTLDDIKKIF